jgi:hypothetical protein
MLIGATRGVWIGLSIPVVAWRRRDPGRRRIARDVAPQTRGIREIARVPQQFVCRCRQGPDVHDRPIPPALAHRTAESRGDLLDRSDRLPARDSPFDGSAILR